MAETFTKFDSADYPQTSEAIAAYLEDAAQDGDPAAMAAALSVVACVRGKGRAEPAGPTPPV